MNEYISKAEAIEACRECVRVYPNRFYNGIDAARSAIFRLPAADVRPVVHGKWETETLDSGQFWANYCSNCDYYLPYGLEWKPNYCPWCGADMREG